MKRMKMALLVGVVVVGGGLTWDVAHHFLKRFLCSPLPVVRRAGQAALAEDCVWVRNRHGGGHFF